MEVIAEENLVNHVRTTQHQGMDRPVMSSLLRIEVGRGQWTVIAFDTSIGSTYSNDAWASRVPISWYVNLMPQSIRRYRLV